MDGVAWHGQYLGTGVVCRSSDLPGWAGHSWWGGARSCGVAVPACQTFSWLGREEGTCCNTWES